jgi:hypothetical protein
MRATIDQAEKNERNLSITKTGYGHWRIECDYRGKRIGTVTTDSQSVDDFNSEFGEKDPDGFNRRKQGYQMLVNRIISDKVGRM